MENLYVKMDSELKKPVIGRYSFMGGSFCVALLPEKLSLFAKWRMKRQLALFNGALTYISGEDVPYINLPQTDGSLCIAENIEMLCRKICKNNAIPVPPKIVLYDSTFTGASAEMLENLGRMCSEIYVVTKSNTALGYAEYMLEEYGCVVCVSEYMADADIVICADRLETVCCGIVIDVFGMNEHIECISELFFEYRDICNEDKMLFGTLCNSRMYDFLRLSGVKINQNVNFVGYG